MKKTILIGSIIVMTTIGSSEIFACGIEGSAKRTDGSDVNGNVVIKTHGYPGQVIPRNGYYSLDLGSSACGHSVDIFVNGYSFGTYSIPNSGNANVNVTLKGSSDEPVR